jgi:predicted RNase H-like HicB family nuclease
METGMRKCSFSEYVAEAIKHARYEYCGETESWTAFVEELPGCWAQADSVEDARRELMEVIEGWVLLGIRSGDALPAIGNRKLGLPEMRFSRATAPAH